MSNTNITDGNGVECRDCKAYEKQINQLVQERDDAAQAISQAYFLLTGRSPEWSNHFGYKECLEEMQCWLDELKREYTK